MPINFNVEPWYDDFDETKNFHRILFKPGRAVQARELTQSQTILQDQINKFADHIFKQNSPVTGGQITLNNRVNYVKLQETYLNSTIDVTQFNGLLVKNFNGTVIAQVVAVASATGGDAPTLILSYKTGNHFTNSDIIYDTLSNLAVQAIAIDATGPSSVISISKGVFYVLGNFVQIQPSTIILEKYNNTPSKRVGVSYTETTYDYIDDTSLLDPAVGASNYQAPGADRYVISLFLDAKPLTFGDDDDFIQLVSITNGISSKTVDGSVYSVIDDYFSKRDYETNGDYVVTDFKLTPRTNVDADKYTLSVGKGLAYVHGYRTSIPDGIDVVSNRARTTNSENNTPVYIDYGSYFYVDTLRATSSSFFDVTTAQPIAIHCVDTANIRTSNAATYNSTVIASGYLRNFVYQQNTSDGDANTYIYKAFVNDLQNAVQSAYALAGASNTITLPGYFSNKTDAYIGVNISITSGPSAGDFRTITAYNGSTHVATVNQAWTTTPTTASLFALNFDTKDAENIVYADASTYAIKSYAKISNYGKVGNLVTGDAILENTNAPELLFRVGSPYVATITDSSFTTQQLSRDKVFNYATGVASTQLNYGGSYLDILNHFGTPSTTLSSDLAKQNFLVMVTAVGSGCIFNVGDIVSFANTATRTITLNSDSSIATLSVSDAGGSFTASVLEKVYASNGTDAGYLLKYKNLITANTSVVSYGSAVVGNSNVYVDDTPLGSTGQVYIQNAGLVSPGNKQSLYLTDVKKIRKILDTRSAGTTPTTINLSTYADVTNNYTFDNGQKDSHYDHASITLRPGAPQPAGNLLVFVDYYQHAGGTGYFSLTSYESSTLQESYTEIPNHTSKNGTIYALRDCLDFRPARQNSTTAFQYKYTDIGDKRYGVFIPSDNTQFVTDYEYYLGRKDKLVITKDGKVNIIEGAPSLNPLFPTEPDGSLVVANLTHEPYTGYIPTEAPAGKKSNLSIEKVKHKRYTMQDIAGLENRINKIEYYTSLSLLEQKASTLQISDSYGLNRFKNGILVDDFSSFSATNTDTSDFNASVNRRERTMSAPSVVKNFPLKSTAFINNINNLDNTISLSYKIAGDGYTQSFSLPYTSANAISQKFASRTVSVNPYSVSRIDGVLTLTPNMDNWVDEQIEPAILITSPTLDVFASSSGGSKFMTTTDWKSIPGTQYDVRTVTTEGFIETTKVETYEKQTQTSYYGAYDKIGNTYSIDNGFVKDITVLPYIRPQQVVVRGKNLLYHTSVNTYFDKTNVDKYFRKANIIELSSAAGVGQFKEGDVIGYMSGGTFNPTGVILGFYYTNSSTVRLYVASEEGTTTSYDGGTGRLQNGFFNSSGTYTSNTAYGTISSTSHFGGRVTSVTGNKIKLSGLSPNVNNYFVSNTINIVQGTGSGQSATISAYYGANQTAVLSSTIDVAVNSIYSIGNLTTSKDGALYGIFNIPENTFHNGERLFRIDNSYGNVDAETTYCQASFYAEGIQSTSQSLMFGASVSGAKGVNNVSKTESTFVKQTVTTVDNTPPPAVPEAGGGGGGDPLSQSFLIDKNNYPNGMFLESVDFFFENKPTNDDSTISLYVVGTLNGYPNNEIINNSIVTLTPNQVKTSSQPHYLDENAKTNFKFSEPIYIQSGVLYAFVLKSSSKDYYAWTAYNGDIAKVSSVKILPTDATPATITKISGSPYIGTLFMSQNTLTWTAEQNESLMFVANRCVFNTSVSPTVSFVVPKKLPQRTLIEQSISNYLNANTMSSSIDSISNTNILVDAFNVTTTDFTPSTTGITYKYRSTLTNGTLTNENVIVPGKFGTPTQDDIYLNDGKGERVLDANSNTSFILTATLSSLDNAVSPIVSDAGLSIYAISWDINDAELSNNIITLSSGGSGYNAQTTSVTVSAPDLINGTQAYASANVSGGIVQSVWLTSNGSGYITTPTITVSDANTAPGTGAIVRVTGETSPSGGNISAKHITKIVTLDAGFDSGDLNVYLTAYRPINTDIHVYYKILSRNDTQNFNEGNWQLMTKTKNSESKYSQSRTDVIEYTFAPGTDGTEQGYVSYTSTNGQSYTSFQQFAIKVVLTSSDHTFVPFVDDLRVIALPENVNTTF